MHGLPLNNVTCHNGGVFDVSNTCVDISSIAPALVSFVIANDIELDAETLQHHVHSEGLVL